MSERIVDNPANHGWVEENGKWVWEGGATTGHIEDGTIQGQITTWDVAKTEWTPEGAVVVDGGNVGIGTDSPSEKLALWGNGSATSLYVYDGAGSTAGRLTASGDSVDISARGSVNSKFTVTTGSGSGSTALTIDASGDATFSGTVSATTEFTSGSNWANDATASMRLSSTNGLFTKNPAVNHLTCYSGGTANANVVASISKDGDATFSGTVDAAGFTINGVPISGGGDLWSQVPEGIYYGGHVICGNAGEDVAGKSVLTFGIARQWVFRQFGTGASAKLDLHAAVGGNKQFVITSLDAPTVASITFESTSGHIRTIGNVYAVNVQASSDERLKDNITTAPVGLIDSLKGREWDWKESGEKGSGVVAQELEKVLPHLVDEDEDGMKSVAYNGLVAYLIEEIKALKAEVEALK